MDLQLQAGITESESGFYNQIRPWLRLRRTDLRPLVEFSGVAEQQVDDVEVLMLDSDVKRRVVVTHQ